MSQSNKEPNVHDEIEFMPLTPEGPAGGDGADLRRLHDVPVELAVEIGRTRMTIGQTLQLRPGSAGPLNRLARRPGGAVALLINGKPLARGEVVVIDEELGLPVSDVVSASRGTIEEEGADMAARQDVDAGVLGGVADPLHDPFSHGDSLADASVDDLPMG